MHTLIFQIVLKQWDKSQRNPEYQNAIAQTDNEFHVKAQPQFVLFDLPCVFDQHALDFTAHPLEATTAEHIIGKQAGRPIKQSLLKDGSAKLDRFIISHNHQHMLLAYEDESGVVRDIGNLNNLANGWIQAKYQWRYRIEKNDEIFWQYEEVTLNAALVVTDSSKVFLDNPPAISFNDI